VATIGTPQLPQICVYPTPRAGDEPAPDAGRVVVHLAAENRQVLRPVNDAGTQRQLWRHEPLDTRHRIAPQPRLAREPVGVRPMRQSVFLQIRVGRPKRRKALWRQMKRQVAGDAGLDQPQRAALAHMRLRPIGLLIITPLGSIDRIEQA
jgi:hypothetical protein